MTPLAQAMLVVFIVACCMAAAAHIYATRYFFPRWAAGFRKREQHRGYGSRACIGYLIFLAALGVAFGAGAIAEHWGGGWD